ncbi:MAG: dTDP-4-dehydrorhamnose 3,5-epimerase [Thermoplasmataceae archaeon]
MPFNFVKREINGVILVEPRSFDDERGFFFENYKKSDFVKNGIKFDFVQDNSSYSDSYVLRGLHFQKPPYEQGKLVRVITGKILDVAIDIRKGSITYGKYVSEILSGSNKKMLWVPPGFAHGFLTYEPSFVHYKVTKEYNKDSESGIIWNDKILGIDWGNDNINLSSKDQQWKGLNEFESPFNYGEF